MVFNKMAKFSAMICIIPAKNYFNILLFLRLSGGSLKVIQILELSTLPKTLQFILME